MKIVVVPHGKKLEGVGSYEPILASDPPMTMEGKKQMADLSVQIYARCGSAFDAVYCSFMDRACGTMCTVVKLFNTIKRVVCIAELGQYSNLDSDGTVIAYPGHEQDNVLTWQQQGLAAMQLIWKEVVVDGGALEEGVLGKLEAPVEKMVLVFTHRPILAGLVAAASDITDEEGIRTILNDKGLVGSGFRVFTFTGEKLTLTA